MLNSSDFIPILINLKNVKSMANCAVLQLSCFLPAFAKILPAPLITEFWIHPVSWLCCTTIRLTDGCSPCQKGLFARYILGGGTPLWKDITTLLLRKAVPSPPEDWFDFSQFKGIRSILREIFKKEYHFAIFGLVLILASSSFQLAERGWRHYYD